MGQNRTEHCQQPNTSFIYTLSSPYPIQIITILTSITSDEFQLYINGTTQCIYSFEITFQAQHIFVRFILLHEAVVCSLTML